MPNDRFYITCAIDYPNSPPHLGTAYEKIAADVIARYQRLLGRDVRFLLGLDEHSQNVEQKAIDQGLEPSEYTDRMATIFQDTWAKLGVSNDIFVRTTEERHRRAVLAILERVEANGDIYTDTYNGWYCVGCEAFYSERDLVDGKCPQHLTEPDWREEENAFFRMSRYTEPLKARIAAHPEFVLTDVRRNEILALLDQGLDDISISRRAAGWGIPMPGYEGQTVYVWFDALTNYLTGLGYPDEDEGSEYADFWPADVHLVGKDITRFHAVIWPAMLLAAGLPLPRTIFGHGFVQQGGGRMSKTIRNVIDPLAAAAVVGVDALRYFLIREVPFGRDLDFDLDRLEERYNADLANDLGNLFQRTLAMAGKYRGAELTKPLPGEPATKLPAAGVAAIHDYRERMDAYDLQGGVAAAWRLVSAANLAIDEAKPWELAGCKDDTAAAEKLDRVLWELVDALRTLAVLLQPVVPGRAKQMFARLGIAASLDSEPQSGSGSAIPLAALAEPAESPWRLQPGDALFPRLES